eukprot:SAG22_NODE_9679_length_575_cov_1.056723_1_plen_42_part_10
MEAFWDSNGRTVSKIVETAIEVYTIIGTLVASVNGDTCAHRP